MKENGDAKENGDDGDLYVDDAEEANPEHMLADEPQTGEQDTDVDPEAAKQWEQDKAADREQK